jgi:flagellar motility protein MotE (MotC chaperone)
MRQLRLIPIVIFATSSLLVIKTIGFVADDGRKPFTSPTFVEALSAKIFTLAATEDVEITGATPEAKPAQPGPSDPSKQAALPKTAQNPAATASSGLPSGLSPAERALYERLQERRQELDARSRDMELRENLIKAAEQRLEGRIEELKELEGGKGGVVGARLKSLIVMYETMKSKEAARIFDRLEMKTLVDIANQMNPRKLSDVLAQMKPETAEKLTLELVKLKSGGERALPATDLPKVEGQQPKHSAEKPEKP